MYNQVNCLLLLRSIWDKWFWYSHKWFNWEFLLRSIRESWFWFSHSRVNYVFLVRSISENRFSNRYNLVNCVFLLRSILLSWLPPRWSSVRLILLPTLIYVSLFILRSKCLSLKCSVTSTANNPLTLMLSFSSSLVFCNFSMISLGMSSIFGLSFYFAF